MLFMFSDTNFCSPNFQSKKKSKSLHYESSPIPNFHANFEKGQNLLYQIERKSFFKTDNNTTWSVAVNNENLVLKPFSL